MEKQRNDKRLMDFMTGAVVDTVSATKYIDTILKDDDQTSTTFSKLCDNIESQMHKNAMSVYPLIDFINRSIETSKKPLCHDITLLRNHKKLLNTDNVDRIKDRLFENVDYVIESGYYKWAIDEQHCDMVSDESATKLLDKLLSDYMNNYEYYSDDRRILYVINNCSDKVISNRFMEILGVKRRSIRASQIKGRVLNRLCDNWHEKNVFKALEVAMGQEKYTTMREFPIRDIALGIANKIPPKCKDKYFNWMMSQKRVTNSGGMVYCVSGTCSSQLFSLENLTDKQITAILKRASSGTWLNIPKEVQINKKVLMSMAPMQRVKVLHLIWDQNSFTRPECFADDITYSVVKKAVFSAAITKRHKHKVNHIMNTHWWPELENDRKYTV